MCSYVSSCAVGEFRDSPAEASELIDNAIGVELVPRHSGEGAGLPCSCVNRIG